jgi:transketolase
MSDSQKSAIINVISFIGAALPLLAVGAVIVATRLGMDPPEVGKEVEELEKQIAESEWASRLASAMAKTPEAQEKVKQLLARELARKIVRKTARG